MSITLSRMTNGRYHSVMALMPYQSIELEILRLTMGADRQEGYPTALPQLRQLLEPWTESSDGREIIDCLRMLHQRKQAELWRWQGQWIKFLRGNTDAEFFYVGQFNIRATPGTIRRLQILEKESLEKGKKVMTNDSRAAPIVQSSFIDEGRLIDLRQLSSSQFDFKKLIRLCEELNSSYVAGNYYATAMLTRSLLDHVPPVFGKSTFEEVANNYSGGGKSFQDAMQHLQNASRKVGDGHLHMQIRKSETLPTAQQVHCIQQLDLLLAEIIRIKP